MDWEAIQRVGFPIAMVIYLFTRFEPLLQKVLAEQQRLRGALFELRRAQLLYIIGHPQFSQVVKDQAQTILLEATTDAEAETGRP